MEKIGQVNCPFFLIFPAKTRTVASCYTCRTWRSWIWAPMWRPPSFIKAFQCWFVWHCDALCKVHFSSVKAEFWTSRCSARCCAEAVGAQRMVGKLNSCLQIYYLGLVVRCRGNSKLCLRCCVLDTPAGAKRGGVIDHKNQQLWGFSLERLAIVAKTFENWGCEVKGNERQRNGMSSIWHDMIWYSVITYPCKDVVLSCFV